MHLRSFLKNISAGKRKLGFSNVEPISEFKDVKLFLAVTYDFEMFMRILPKNSVKRARGLGLGI